jgi:homocysteine S-methyltransferase
MRDAGDQSHEEGLKIAQELLSQARELVQGVYIETSYQRYDVAVRLTERLRSASQVSS